MLHVRVYIVTTVRGQYDGEPIYEDEIRNCGDDNEEKIIWDLRVMDGRGWNACVWCAVCMCVWGGENKSRSIVRGPQTRGGCLEFHLTRFRIQPVAHSPENFSSQSHQVFRSRQKVTTVFKSYAPPSTTTTMVHRHRVLNRWQLMRTKRYYYLRAQCRR